MGDVGSERTRKAAEKYLRLSILKNKELFPEAFAEIAQDGADVRHGRRRARHEAIIPAVLVEERSLEISLKAS